MGGCQASEPLKNFSFLEWRCSRMVVMLKIFLILKQLKWMRWTMKARVFLLLQMHRVIHWGCSLVICSLQTGCQNPPASLRNPFRKQDAPWILTCFKSHITTFMIPAVHKLDCLLQHKDFRSGPLTRDSWFRALEDVLYTSVIVLMYTPPEGLSARLYL